MKKLFLLLSLPLTLCAALEYEFLTPGVLVLKSSAPLPENIPALAASKRGVWQKENALQRDSKGRILRKPDVMTYTYLVLKHPFKDQETRAWGKHTLTYDSAKPSSLFKLNQLGNGVTQKRKYAYLGAWLGSAGPLPLKHLAGKEFELRRTSDSKTVFKNKITARRSDPLYQGKIPFTGEEVMELDYSCFNTRGTYYFHLPGIGRSMDFVIGPEPLNEAFYIHARGLYHKRCGIEKKQPFTAWEAPLCHKQVRQGTFPGNEAHYRKGKGEKSAGFFDFKDNRIAVRHFDLISAQPRGSKLLSAPGGWHDAADYDRRPFHLRIVDDLATLYLMKPENFIDGQLNIPESGNGIPDLLDEAAWGVKHLLAVQRPDGGVGTWFETTGHPGPGEGLPHQDKRTYFVSAPSRNGTLEYAAAVSTLALAMKKANALPEAEKLLASAIKAWEFAQKPDNRLVSWFHMKNKIVSYREEPFLHGGHLVKSAHTLYLLTGDKKYLAPLAMQSGRIKETFNKEFWKWSPLYWMTLELFPVKELASFRSEYKKVILRNACQMLDDQENAYPFRTLWHAADAGWVHTMAWGNSHPLRRAITLIAAHKMTGEEKFLTGARLAGDFHNGANPPGRSMTSGLGKIYPAVFLDLISYAGNTREFVPGITPYGNTFGLDRNAVKLVYKKNADKLPIFRRYVSLEFLSVPAAEYSVWETIAPAAVTSGYLIETPMLPSAALKKRHPVSDFRLLPGYTALP